MDLKSNRNKSMPISPSVIFQTPDYLQTPANQTNLVFESNRAQGPPYASREPTSRCTQEDPLRDLKATVQAIQGKNGNDDLKDKKIPQQRRFSGFAKQGQPVQPQHGAGD